MDRERFDAVTRLFATTRSRRSALGALFVAALISTNTETLAKRGKGRRRDRGARKGIAASKRPMRQARAQSVAAHCFPGAPCIPSKGAGLANCDFGGTSALANQNVSGANLDAANLRDADASGANLGRANLKGACLVDADLSGASLKGANLTKAVLCRTRLPNGAIDNSGCNRATPCCQTCVPLNGDGCNIGGSCCGNQICTGGGGGTCVCPRGTTLCNDGVCRECCANDVPGACGGGRTCCNGACCAAGDVCNITVRPNVCCAPSATACDGRCGMVTDNCGKPRECGACPVCLEIGDQCGAAVPTPCCGVAQGAVACREPIKPGCAANQRCCGLTGTGCGGNCDCCDDLVCTNGFCESSEAGEP